MMSNKYKDVFESKDPSDDLLRRILFKIDKKRAQKKKFRMAVYLGIFFIALGISIPVWNEFQLEVTQSGFTQFISLIFSDTGIVLSYWKDFSVAILESFPVFGTIGLLTVLFMFLSSTKSLVREIGTMHNTFLKIN